MLADAVCRELASVASFAVDGVFEAMDRDLAKHGLRRLIELACQQAEPCGWGVGERHQMPEHQRLPEHRCGLGDRQWPLHLQDALWSCQQKVEAMPELVGEREHVAQ